MSHAPTVAALRQEAVARFEKALRFVEARAGTERQQYAEFELALRDEVRALGAVLVVLFLALREAHVMERFPEDRFHSHGRAFRRAPQIARNLTSLFGVVRYWRTYMREILSSSPRGFHPLDVSLGLGADRFSWNVLSVAVRLATKLSFAEARSTMSEFLSDAPSTEVIEQALLGFGRHTEAWFEQLPTPTDDGDVLVIQIDGKGAPTATDRELRRRRGKRRKKPQTSPRHRGRERRGRHATQPRRKAGDKAKNAKVATMVVMYTLQSRGTRRKEGPRNVVTYASFAPKRHAFEMARHLSARRGFGPDSGRLVQLVVDGDKDLRELGAEYLPHAEVTIDYYHVVEYLWLAGECLFAQGSCELKRWVETQKRRLFQDDAEAVVREIDACHAAIPRTGPGNKGRRERLKKSRNYLEKRLANIRYGALRRRDLEIATGVIEGAVKHIIGRRCDHGGMRWIKERAEAVVQLRCIEVGGQWAAFEHFVRKRLAKEARESNASPRLQTNQPRALPAVAA